jgi:hypothetical protein
MKKTPAEKFLEELTKILNNHHSEMLSVRVKEGVQQKRACKNENQ